ncbi:hypothetical protein HPB49_010582 [Dermacentor silvarum]|uniref:Uncharacterized protein n=1 Tax=Dermacentor silvarum TaxID=543639 RepID=A0ACB8DCC3_DERSI|nr:hypothetical protein HPB49_010582 [Dermacentor silvarum]
MPQPSVASPIQPTDIQLTGAPFIFSTKYIQTASGALNLVETCLAVVLFHSLCSHSEESLSEALFMVSFTYSIAGLYLLLNGTCNQPPPPAGTSRQLSTLQLIQLLIFHCAGSIAFLACGCYVLTRHFGVARAIVAGLSKVARFVLNYLSSTVGPDFCVSVSSPEPAVLVSHIAFAVCRARMLSFCMKNGHVPQEVAVLFGSVKPSIGHVRRMCRILRSEIWRQVRLLYDWLKAVCYSRDASVVAERKFRSYRRLSAQTTEFWWTRLLLVLRSRPPHRKEKTQPVSTGFQVLGNVTLPDEVAELLKNGPKFSTEPRIPAHELLALNRRIARKAELEDQERCLLDGVDCLRRTVTKNAPPSTAVIKRVVSFFRDNELRLLLSDKEGGFVIAPAVVFNKKAIQAIDKNFILAKEKAQKTVSVVQACVHLSHALYIYKGDFQRWLDSV